MVFYFKQYFPCIRNIFSKFNFQANKKYQTRQQKGVKTSCFLKKLFVKIFLNCSRVALGGKLSKHWKQSQQNSIVQNKNEDLYCRFHLGLLCLIWNVSIYHFVVISAPLKASKSNGFPLNFLSKIDMPVYTYPHPTKTLISVMFFLIVSLHDKSKNVKR